MTDDTNKPNESKTSQSTPSDSVAPSKAASSDKPEPPPESSKVSPTAAKESAGTAAAPSNKVVSESTSASSTTQTEPVAGSASTSGSADAPEKNRPAVASVSTDNNTPVSKTRPPANDFSGGGHDGNTVVKARTWPLWLAVLLMLLLMAGVATWFWGHLQTWQDRLDHAVSQHQSSSGDIQQLEQRYDAEIRELRQKLDQEQQRQQQLRQQIDDTSRRMLSIGATGRTDWLLAEVEYLLRLANQRLRMERDYEGSLSILEAADQVLAETKEVAVYPVREALAKEMVALQSVADIDRQGLYLRLEALVQQIESLDQRMFFKEAPLLNEKPLEEEAPPAEHWYSPALNAFKSLDKYFVIRHRDAPVEPLLAPEQIYYLRQNLRLMLEQAEMALLEKDQKVYQLSLQKAEKWVEDYFITNDPVTKAMLKNLQDLQKQRIDPELPDISESLRLLKGLLESTYKRPTPSESSQYQGAAPEGEGVA